MVKLAYFAIVVLLLSFLSSCALHAEKCPGVAKVKSLSSPA